MYSDYFGLSEPSFSIAPDPRYLFLSPQHREALAHLLYGAAANGGFVLLTGEVGTGKTTVCRAFLEQLPEGVEVALILNPALTASELLRAICDEFRIEIPSGEYSAKDLVDRLNRYLLDAHAKGRRPLLVIDEAQNLRSRVLEQIRLLTNLETSTHKLLQIFLIGQPELRRMLSRDALRQLDQRITARAHLYPFSERDTAEYIRHRIAVAGVERPLFSARSIRRIHRYCGGVPRLINILCDRALLGAYVTRSAQVTPAIIDQAAREVRGQSSLTSPAVRSGFITAGLFTLAFGLGWWQRPWFAAQMDRFRADPQEKIADVQPMSSARSPQKPQASPALPPAVVVDPAFPAETLLSESEALRLLLRYWGLKLDALDAEASCTQITRFGLRCAREQGELSDVRFFDRPAALEITTDAGETRFLALSALDADSASLDQPDGAVSIPISQLEQAWRGRYILIWQPPPSGGAVIKPGDSEESIRWLRRLLAQVPGLDFTAGDSGRFDPPLKQALETFQSAQGLEVDGMAGPRTLIRLHDAVGLPGIAHLSRAIETTENAP